MMHYSGIDPSAVAYNSHSPNVTVMNRGTTAAAMQAAAWSQNPASCRYNPSAVTAADYMAGSAATFATDPVTNFYQESYRHPLISGNSAMPGVYYPTPQMLMQSRTITSPTEISVTNPSPTATVPTNGAQSTAELASPTDSLGSKGETNKRLISFYQIGDRLNF